jgi:hypothetical protein
MIFLENAGSDEEQEYWAELCQFSANTPALHHSNSAPVQRITELLFFKKLDWGTFTC